MRFVCLSLPLAQTDLPANSIFKRELISKRDLADDSKY